MPRRRPAVTAAALIALTLLAALPRNAFSQASAPSTPVEPAGQPIAVPLLKGMAAPFDGVMLNEPKAIEVRRNMIQLADCSGMLEVKTNALVKLEGELAQAKEASMRQTWWGRNAFWFGAATGVVVSGLMVWSGAKVLK